MSVCKRVLVLVLVLDWTKCLPQAPPDMLRYCMTGFPQKWGPGPPEMLVKVDTICTVPLDCGTPTTRRLYPFGASGLRQDGHPVVKNTAPILFINTFGKGVL